ncbi:MAG: DinB family protein [Calditrichia bacterium]
MREVVGHMLDTERVFNYRALRFARNDKTVLHGFEENDYIRNATFNDYPLSELAEAFASVRIATLSLFIHMDEAAWLRRGVAFKGEMSVRAIAWIIAGHELHHRSILHEKYIL